MTDQRFEGAGSSWWALHQNSGLLPVLLDSMDENSALGERRPWDSELLVWDTDVPGADSVPQILGRLWDDEHLDPRPPRVEAAVPRFPWVGLR
jgi:hypothetical protein